MESLTENNLLLQQYYDSIVKKCVPPIYIPHIKCFAVVEHHSTFSADSNPYIIMCTKDGYLVEVVSHCVTGRCNINCLDSEHITLFRTYEPFCLYYIVKNGDEIVIVAKRRTLKIVCHLWGVHKVLVYDFWECGKPQVGIWLSENTSDKPSTVTDFQDGFLSEEGESSEDTSEHMINRLSEVQAHLKAKEVDLLSQRSLKDKLKLAVASNKVTLVKLITSFQCVIHEKLILGLSCDNISDTDMVSVRVLLCSKEIPHLCYTVFVFCRRTGTERDNTVLWEKTVEVPQKEHFYVLVIFDVPEFHTFRTLKLKGIAQFETKEHCLDEVETPSFHVNALDLFNNVFMPFVNVPPEQSFLCVQAGSEHVPLEVEHISLHSTPTAVFGTHLKFEPVCAGRHFFHKGAELCPLAGMLVYVVDITSCKWKIDVYARNHAQVFLLVQALYASKCVHSVLLASERPRTHGLSFTKASHSELELVS